jgi:ribosomal protein L24E
MPRCTFCKQQYEFPKGITVVQKSGVAKFFCSNKCRKSSEMGRDNRKVKWVRKNKKTEEAKE